MFLLFIIERKKKQIVEKVIVCGNIIKKKNAKLISQTLTETQKLYEENSRNTKRISTYS